MGILDLVVIAIGLSMDAFAVSICKGLCAGKATAKQALTAALWFGGFQALMPLIGYLLGYSFKDIIASVDHWIAFVLLVWIGVSMIRSARSCENTTPDFSAKAMFPLAVATSIDALATGVMFSFMEVNIVTVVLLIGVITAVCSFIGVKAGSYLGEKFKSRAETAGGIVLILMGTKILLEHLGII
ncbi:MAG: manganese efflux pump MntP family protein [Solobacterium sp.]|jgi:putative Mn2+ efflux pump MntP|nr:manganese efflux pump MntP family protein [Solobacterium sp.]